MRPSRRPIIIATRKSPLAMAQSEAVARALGKLNPNIRVHIEPMVSEADKVTNQPLASLGGKGLFTRTIEKALISGEADIAIHSLKDMPTDNTPGLIIAAIPPRGRVDEVLISKSASSIKDLPQGASFGTSSPRRAAQLLSLRPDLNIKLLRGNIQTRLRKVLEDDECDATLLAAVGLERGGLSDQIKNTVDTNTIIPAVGQGALAIQCRSDDHTSIRRVMMLNHSLTASMVEAERKIANLLNADCHSPIAVHASSDDHVNMTVIAAVFSGDGTKQAIEKKSGSIGKMNKLITSIVDSLKAQGAERLLADASMDSVIPAHC